jgi:Rod binding domain-containing protein
MLPQALSSGVMHAGGLGLAAQMTRDLEGTSPAVGTGDTAAQTRASGGVGPVSSATTANQGGVVPADTGASAGAGASGGTPA